MSLNQQELLPSKFKKHMINFLKITVVLLVLSSFSLAAQNKAILYGFDEIPQVQLLNPAFYPSYKAHVGIPFLSGISINAGVSEVTMADVFRDDNVDFTTKVTNALNRITENDYVSFNSQVEVLSGSYKINNRDYLSAGFYTEVDFFANYPKDIITLVNEGNAAKLNQPFLLSQVNIKAEALSVLHVGLSRKINENLVIGGRLKLYSGIANLTSTENRGTFTTRLGNDNIYTHYLNDISFEGNSSGVYYEDEDDVPSVASKLFFNNIGLGIDVGFTYQIDNQSMLSASILDIGYVNYSSDVKNITVKGNYTFSGIEFEYDSANNDYWQNLEDDIKANIPSEENENSYAVMRPIKFNAAYKYSWGRSRKEDNCSDMSYHNYYNNSIGAQLFSVFRPTGPKFAMTGFYERKLSKSLNTKFTYTVDDFSYTNFGFGLSTKIGKFQLYSLIDNIFELTDIADANTTSFQFGMNLIFN